MTQAAAAFAISGCQLPQGRVDLTAAVTAAVPNGADILFRFAGRRNGNQHAKPHSCNIPLTGPDNSAAAAVPGCTPLQSAGIQKNLFAAVAAAVPDDIAVFPVLRWTLDRQLADTKAGADLGGNSLHTYTSRLKSLCFYQTCRRATAFRHVW